MSNKIRDMLEDLANDREDQASALALYEAEVAAIMQPVEKELEEAKARYQSAVIDINLDIAQLEVNIKEATLEYGETVKGESLKAQYTRGRVSWNTKGLVGYAVANPDVLAFRKQGSPYVSIRKA